jgi:hypothetical protein
MMSETFGEDEGETEGKRGETHLRFGTELPLRPLDEGSIRSSMSEACSRRVEYWRFERGGNETSREFEREELLDLAVWVV